jgi:hypothetical protein
MPNEEMVQTEQGLEVEQKIRTKLEEEYNSRLTSEVSKISKQMTDENQKLLTAAIEKFRKEMVPPSDADIQKLLEQEYAEFHVELKVGKDTRTFIIREVPMEVEKKIYKKIKSILVPLASDLAAVTMNLLEGDAAKKVVQLMNTFEPVLDAMTGVCAICLNPYGEEKEINEEWVRKNLGSTRILKIVTAQLEANKMRDFFSLLFRNTKQLTQ